MQPHQQRVVDEKAQLQEKIEKLETFLGGSIFQTLPLAEQERLNRQFRHMNEYAQVLGERIKAFDDPGAPPDPPPNG